MNYQDLKEIIKNRRSIRKFKDESISKEILKEIIDCARWAPSSTNSQPWKFIGITNKEIIQKIASNVEEDIRKLQDDCIKKGNKEVALKLKAFSKYVLFFKNAPSIIICLTEPYKSKFADEIIKEIFDKETVNVMLTKESIKSTSLAAQNIMLAAYAMGLGTCAMSTPAMMGEEKIKELLNIEEKYSIMLIIALGKPNEQARPTPRKSLDEIFEYIGE